jgi:hypothetical protein
MQHTVISLAFGKKKQQKRKEKRTQRVVVPHTASSPKAINCSFLRHVKIIIIDKI